ncbi:MAG: AAA family ATPase [Cryomorphaceae bacterium]|nr:AAA family ATPase [Cryomorphaceae bacterium]
MHTQPLKVQIENFRAIQKAQIQIDDITVIAGVNGSGKSTVSKFAYQVIKTAVHFDELVEGYYSQIIRREMAHISIVVSELYASLPNGTLDENELRFRHDLRFFERQQKGGEAQDSDRLAYMIKFKDFLNSIRPYFSQENLNIQPDINESRQNRLKKSLTEKLKINDDSLTILDLLERLKIHLHNILAIPFETKDNRPIDFAEFILKNTFESPLISKSINVFESDVPILDKTKNSIGQVFSIEHVFYLDTPMMLGLTGEENDHRSDLDAVLRKKSSSQTNKSFIESHIKSEIIKGEVESDETNFSQESFVYKRLDGSVFDLLDCATGLKSFAIIQLLLQRGLLTDKTLLIIDEPEAHLHPQWVVEYARMVVLLNKELGVRFLIASHHPDMVSAIKYIGEKENPSANVNFYLAEKSTSDNYQYVYNHLGTDIEAIFASFNAAFDKLDEYGETHKL